MESLKRTQKFQKADRQVNIAHIVPLLLLLLFHQNDLRNQGHCLNQSSLVYFYYVSDTLDSIPSLVISAFELLNSIRCTSD